MMATDFVGTSSLGVDGPPESWKVDGVKKAVTAAPIFEKYPTLMSR
jgi:hypothetical protein